MVGLVVFLWLLFCLATSAYCLFVHVPFIWTNFIQLHPFPWLDFFARRHAWIYGGLWILSAAVFTGRRESWGGPLGAAVAVLGLLGALLAALPGLSSLRPGSGALALSCAAWAPFLVLAAAAAWERGRPFRALEDPALDRRLLRAALLAAFLCASGFGAGAGLALSMELKPFCLAWAWSLSLHALLFLAAASAVSLTKGFAHLAAAPGAAAFCLSRLLAAGVLASFFARVVLASVPFTGWPAWAVSISLTLALTVAAEALTPPPGAISWALAAGLGAWASLELPLMDWNGVLQACAVMGVWWGAAALAYQTGPRRQEGPGHSWALCLAFLVFIAIFQAERLSRYDLDRLLAEDRVRWSALLERYAAREPSFRLARRILSARKEGELFALMQRHTNIPRDLPTPAVEIRLSEALAPSSGFKPHIFIIVVDSLRRDYLRPYNPAVRFTPEISRFAAESSVFTNAFTRYGATGLSEPSIWTGAMIPHKQYPEPFQPLNSLQKLLRLEGYRGFIVRDAILDAIVQKTPEMRDLTDGRRQDRLCPELASLGKRLDELGRPKAPLFFYAQPQDLHVSMINREGRSLAAGAAGGYAGFDAAYASRMRGLDRCFGAFIADLKRRGLYGDSIVVLASDHGDSLGEGGRWGHAYTLFPEIVKIPLLIHLPARFRGLYRDARAAAFLTDVTPTLYALLGHSVAKNRLFGRPLFTPTKGEHDRYLEDYYLLASSYGSVYALLMGNGCYLYIADGINGAYYYYDLAADSQGNRNLFTPDRARELNPRVAEEIRRIAAFYRFPG
ncbi:MAG: sulfatase-like hydrolase/transferase [Elusimicrobia bacterium]|nr:sulfatase-like hydrolase/transferase [Elusimicrobiota bacterium]